MADGEVFKCPACGAALKVEGTALHVECPYCGNTIIVPPDLRPPQATTPPYAPGPTTVIVVQPPPQPVYQALPTPNVPGHGPTRRVRNGTMVLWLLAVAVFGPLLFGVVVAFVNPSLFDEWTSISYGRFATSFGGKGEAPGQLTDPAGVAVDGEGSVYVLEYGGRVQRFDGTGKLQGSWPVGGYSQCIAADRAGFVYVGTGPEVVKYEGVTGRELDRTGLDTPDRYIESLAISADGGLVAARTGPGAAIVRLNGALQETGRLPAPNASDRQPESSGRESIRLAVNGIGHIYVLGRSSNEVFRLHNTGELVDTLGDGLKGQIYALAIDSVDRVYVSDDKYIQVYVLDGTHLGRITLPNNSGPANSLAFGPRDELYALSMQSSTVYKFVVTR